MHCKKKKEEDVGTEKNHIMLSLLMLVQKRISTNMSGNISDKPNKWDFMILRNVYSSFSPNACK